MQQLRYSSPIGLVVSLKGIARCDKISPLMVPVAQLAEHLTVDQVVAGSNPVRHPNE
jgi:hypothetical protein